MGKKNLIQNFTQERKIQNVIIFLPVVLSDVVTWLCFVSEENGAAFYKSSSILIFQTKHSFSAAAAVSC